MEWTTSCKRVYFYGICTGGTVPECKHLRQASVDLLFPSPSFKRKGKLTPITETKVSSAIFLHAYQLLRTGVT